MSRDRPATVTHASFGREDRERYARQLVLPELGPRGQAALARGSVLVIGAGGLGSPVLDSLARAGVGTLRVMDPAEVSRADLSRQGLYVDADVGRPKVEVAAARLRAANPAPDVQADARTFTESGARDTVAAFDVTVDASDNLATRYLVSDACVLAGRPLVFGSVTGLEGQLARLAGGSEPCYRCLFPDPPAPADVPSCAEAGVLGPVAGIVGAWMALEAIRTLAGFEAEPPRGLLHVDAAAWRVQRVRISRRRACAVCGEAPTIDTVRLERSALQAGDPYPGPT